MFAIGQIPTNPIREITCANEEILKDSGIFLAGDGISPRNIGTAILEGKRVAGEIEEWLITHVPRRLLPPTLAGRLIAEVIEGKC
ncbi:hypothetical protein [Pyrococcus kukulkanii]|uniref:hypothetical protein n=1 Tax=Pyrococcus kukulkanii TaxID=1609559 RepID=UPI000AE5D1AF